MSPVPAADAPVSPDAVLDALEAEAIWVMRETAGAFRNPVLMYSIGKDSTVLLHLARKAFYPAPIPFPLLHIDSTWEFQEMYAHRDRVVAELGAQLIVGTNEEGIAEGVTPLTHGVQEYTRIMRTVPLLQSLDAGRFDAAIGGGRRDEERSRAKERIFSLREPGHRWEPRKQRPEFWRTPNTSLNEGQTMRVFPLSNWTELDVWRYVAREELALPSIYYAHRRPVVRRGELWMGVGEFLLAEPGEVVEERSVRYRTVGDATCTAAVESTATSLDAVIAEVMASRLTERGATRADDRFSESAMEDRKREGYF